MADTVSGGAYLVPGPGEALIWVDANGKEIKRPKETSLTAEPVVEPVAEPVAEPEVEPEVEPEAEPAHRRKSGRG